MKIILNGKQKQIESGSNITDLLTQLNLLDKRLAVEVNQEIIPKSAHLNHSLKASDTVEIVHAIGGG